jgi:predicted LPLAT superfamily acyltransferase
MSAVAASWQDVAEKGSVVGVRLLLALSTAFGRRAARAVLPLVALWYVAFHPGVRRASRDYLPRVGVRPTLGAVYRHVLTFARVTLDRLFFAKGDARPFEIATHGEEHLARLRAERRGALLVLAHLGSFEVMRTLSAERSFALNIVGYFRNARMINATLRALNPAVDARLIEIAPRDVGFVFEIERRLAAGELVGTMADRVGFDGKSAAVPFLGGTARLPTGPWLLAAALGCPVYVAFGLYSEPNRYDLYCEPLAERVALPRGGREEAAAELAARYAARLEHYCRLAPLNWFNFYDFWSV